MSSAAEEMDPDSSPVCDVLLWRRPVTAVMVLATGTLVYYHCTALNRSIVALVADVLLVLACAGGAIGVLSRHLDYPVPVEPLAYEMSEEAATCVVAWGANLVGATEGVLRVAASGSDYRLFAKVVTPTPARPMSPNTHPSHSAAPPVPLPLPASPPHVLEGGPGRVGPGLWFVFVVPFLCSKLYPALTEEGPPEFMRGTCKVSACLVDMSRAHRFAEEE
eukprot:jgi/Mesen1/1066/ME000123S00238